MWIGITVAVVVGVACSGTQQSDTKRDELATRLSAAKVKTIEVAATVRSVCERYVVSIEDAYKANRPADHMKLAAGMITLMRRVPLAHLVPCEQVLIAAVKKKGGVPYASVLIEHGYRLAKITNPRNEHRHREIARALPRNVQTTEPSVVFVRTMRHDGFRVYSYNAGAVVLALTYSSFGLAQYAQGAAPENLLRLFEIYRQCRTAMQSGNPLKTKQAERCGILAKEIDDALKGRGGTAGKLTDELMAGLKGGITTSLTACLSSIMSDPTAEMMDRFEQYTDCRRDEMATGFGSAVGPSGLMEGTSGSGIRDSKPVHELLLGAYQSKAPEYTEHVDERGFHAQERFTYARGNEQITVTNWSVQNTDANGNSTETSGTQVVVTDENGGESTYNFENKNGEQVPTSMSYEGPDGAYYAETYDDGTVKDEVILLPDGTFEHNTYDANGNETSSGRCNINGATGDGTAGCDASTVLPPDDMQTSACGGALFETPTKTPVTGLGPWILPNPDDAPQGPLDACLAAALANQPQRCPPSVATCVEPPTSGCGCGSPTAGGPLPHTNPGNIDCGPDSTYNPKTGTCGGNNGDFPGIRKTPKPLPVSNPIKIGGNPFDMRSGTKNAGKLWKPTGADIAKFGLLSKRPNRGGTPYPSHR